jgi:MFS family permease
MADRGAGPEAEPSALAAAVIDEETRRTEARAPEAPVIADDELPGVNAEAMSLREAVRQGGSRTLAIIGILGAIEVFDNAVFNVLAPDIQDAIGVSDTVLGAIGGATGVLFVLGAIPMSSLSDRLPRKNLVAVSMSVWSVILVLTGLAQNAFQLFLARMGAGLGQSTSLPVNGPLLSDTYPIQARAMVFSVFGSSQAIFSMISRFFA